jgi:VIT1/CCC1 family predicted Fe2+/Mn2+ transporter
VRINHFERHRTHRIGWLRAAVLGANDGVVSVASLVVGVAASGATHGNILISGIAGLVAGAMSMAAGEYVSVQSQADTENADLARERKELIEEPDEELAELTGIYVGYGLDEELAKRVAEKLTAVDALKTHAREELGITEISRARPIQAALTSAMSFAAGAVLPVIAAFLSPTGLVSAITFTVTVFVLVVLGGLAAYAGGASIVKGALRVAFWGVLAMLMTAGVGKIFGVLVG